MMMCTRCHKRPAVVIVSSMQGDKKDDRGYCLTCARELNIPQVDEYMKRYGITDDDIKKISDQMEQMADSDNFEMGGSDLMPQMLSKMFGASEDDDDEVDSELPAGMEDNPSSDDASSKRSRSNASKKRKKELKFLNNYCTNLSQRARDGKLDRIIGRDKEISRVIQILSRRTKNNPCLIGEPGVGKTAIAEGIAQKINTGDVPFHLKDKEIYLLDLTALVAGTQFRGQFESRVKGLLSEVKQEGNVILFIDEIHNLVGAGNSEGSMNAANLLKPALSRGEVQVIGATTYDEYRKYIEKDSALERRFQPVKVDEPTIEDTVEVLQGIAEYYETFHHVHISKEMLRLCATLSERYITDRFLPDKAIDLLDESCTFCSLRSPEINTYDDLLHQKNDLEAQEKALEDETEIDYEKLAEIKAGLAQVNPKLEAIEKEMEKIQVTSEDVAKVIELWTGIPASKIEETEYTKLQNLEENLKKRVIGQDEAVSVLAKAIKRTRVQLSAKRRPASFIFVGPTGVGKTELVKALSDNLFDAENDPLIRIDMNEYMEKHSMSRLIGSPPGYVGYDEAGQLTEKVRRHPYSVILFDEVEKAHPDIMNLLLQILDEGRIDDAQGRTVNFENTIICMTSNAGSTDTSIGVGFNRTETEISKEKAMKALREFMRPEFLGRIDEIIVFRNLSKSDFCKIAALRLDEMKEPLAEKNITISYDDAALETIAEKSYGKTYGARDIQRVIRQEIEDKVAETIIDKCSMIQSLSITAKDGELQVIPA